LWPVMEALYKAGLRPTWSRASVTWKTSEGRFFIHPGELPESLPAADIVSYARSGCNATATSQSNAPLMVDSESQTESRRVPADTSSQRLITTLQQDLALAKQRIAAQSIQCCYWRQKYKAYEAKVGPPKLSRQASSQTSGIALSAHVCVQTDTPPPQHSAEHTALTMVQAVQTTPECAFHADACIQTEPLEDHTALVEQALAMQETIQQQAQQIQQQAHQMQQIQAHIHLVASQVDRVGKGKARR
jgi:hypothetical protein